MPRWEPEQNVTQSVLERLIDRAPELAADPPVTRAQSVRQLKNALRRDLEWLLNTRRSPEPAGPEYVETQNSLFNFGLPDVTSLGWDSENDRGKLARMIHETVARFEPRITRLNVIPLESSAATRHVLRFQIEGWLEMDPAPERITFDTVLQLSSGQCQVKGDSNAG
jgi:type VI secretion system protein ImpF